MEVNSIRWSPMELAHCVQLSSLPFYHRDPFDCLLIAQALVESMRSSCASSRISILTSRNPVCSSSLPPNRHTTMYRR